VSAFTVLPDDGNRIDPHMIRASPATMVLGLKKRVPRFMSGSPGSGAYDDGDANKSGAIGTGIAQQLNVQPPENRDDTGLHRRVVHRVHSHKLRWRLGRLRRQTDSLGKKKQAAAQPCRFAGIHAERAGGMPVLDFRIWCA